MNDIHSASRSDPDAEAGSFRITFADLEDIEALVALHLKCFSDDDHIAVMFGKGFIHSAYKWFVTHSETFVLVAKKKEQLLGFTAISEKPYNGPMLRAAKWDALRGLILRPWLAFHPELIRRLVRILFSWRDNHSGDKVAHIAFTGVSPQFQGKGIGKALKNESIRVCRKRGMIAMVTGVKRQNLRAKAMNESAGFVEIPELSTKRFICLRLELEPE